jgi:hypothetical protein
LEVTGRRVLAIGGAESGGEGPANMVKLVADDVQTLVIPDCGHSLTEQAPEKLLAALTGFLPLPGPRGQRARHRELIRTRPQLPMAAAWIDNQHSARHLPVAVAALLLLSVRAEGRRRRYRTID